MRYIILSFFVSYYSFSQNFKAFDQNSKQPIPYVIVFIDSTGYYTNDKGEFNLKDKRFDSLTISHLNYYDLNIKYSELSDSLFLKPKLETLDEVIIMDYKNLKQKKLKSPSKYLNSIIRHNNEVITCLCLKNRKLENAVLTEFIFQLSKNKNLTNKNQITNETVSFRLNFYENNKYNPGKYLNSVLYENLSIKDMITDNYNIKLNFKPKPIILNEDGFCFGLEHLGFKNLIKNKKKYFISIENSFNRSKYFNARTVTNYPLSQKRNLTAMERYPEAFEYLNLKDDPVLIPEMIIYK